MQIDMVEHLVVACFLTLLSFFYFVSLDAGCSAMTATPFGNAKLISFLFWLQ
jgi:hypothetical protein